VSSDLRRFAPATARNREPILSVLSRYATAGTNVLEIASGTGEHAAFLAGHLGVAMWQPTDADEASLASINAWILHAATPALRPAIELDVTCAPWPFADASMDVIVCINMIHISPFEACLALLDGARRTLTERGYLYLYGAYKRDGLHTAPSNAEFDSNLRSRNPSWGVRSVEHVVLEAKLREFQLVEIVDMPANNLSVVLQLRSQTNHAEAR
jgi:cyclopropane fatty-acyl-phospholipid synthase-like methyltransferase